MYFGYSNTQGKDILTGTTFRCILPKLYRKDSRASRVHHGVLPLCLSAADRCFISVPCSQGTSWAPSYDGNKGRLEYPLQPQKYTPRWGRLCVGEWCKNKFEVALS